MNNFDFARPFFSPPEAHHRGPLLAVAHLVRLALMVFIALPALMPACRLPSAQDDPDLVTSLHFTPSAFDSFRRNAELKYTLKISSTLSITIVKRDSALTPFLVKTLVRDLSETKGAHAITWLGDTDQRLFAPAGLYFGVIQTGRQRFETIVEIFHF